MPQITFTNKAEGDNLTPADVNEIKDVVNGNKKWSELETYSLNEFVDLNGVKFISLQDSNINHTPVGDNSDSWWDVVNIFGAVWDAKYNYQLNDITSYEGTLVKSIWDNSTEGSKNVGNIPDLTPGATDSYWEIVKTGGSVEVDGVIGGASIGELTLVYFDSTGKLAVGDNRYTEKAFLAGISEIAGNSGDTITVQSGGPLTGFPSGTFVKGTTYYLGHNGAFITRGAISYEEYIVPVGTAIDDQTLDVRISFPEPNRNYDDGEPIGSIKEFPTYKNRTAQGYVAFDYDNAISQANYPILFAEIGHMFNDAHVAAGDADLSGSSTLFYPTPPPSFYERAGIPDSGSIDATSAIDITNDTITLSSADYNKFKRMKYYSDSYNGVPVYLSGTVPTGLSEDTLYYIGFTDDTNFYIKLYSSESDAISDTSAIDITVTATGTFVLTQEGIVLDDALQGHTLGTGSKGLTVQTTDTRNTPGTADTLYSVATLHTSKGCTLITDDINGTPRTTNETRPKTSIMFKYIKAEYVTTAGEPISALKYDTGWVAAPTSWEDQQITISVSGLVNWNISDAVLFFKDATGNEIQVTTGLGLRDSTATVRERGAVNIFKLSDTSIMLETTNQGFYFIDSAGTGLRRAVVNTDLPYYRIIIKKPNLVSTIFDVSQKTKEYDISTTNQTLTLSLLTGASQVVSATWTGGDGTAKIQFNVPDKDGVYSTSEYEGEGEGHIRFEAVTTSSGNVWKVVDYYDSGSNSNGDWKKELNGTMICNYESTTTINTSSADGSIYYNNTGAITFSKIFYSPPNVIISVKQGSGVCWPSTPAVITTSGLSWIRIVGSNSANTAYWGYEAIGTWK